MNDNQETQQNEIKQLTLAERIQAENEAVVMHQRKNWGPKSAFGSEENMSKEDREKADELLNMQRAYHNAIHQHFNNVLNSGRSPMHVLLAPRTFAKDHFLSTNAVMTTIIAPLVPVTKEDHERLVESILDVRQPVDNTSALLQFLATNYNNHYINLAECHWLMELAGYLHCVRADFNRAMGRVFNVNTKMEELVFRNMLDNTNDDHVMLKETAINQYRDIEVLLKRI